MKIDLRKSVGIVETKYVTFEEGIKLDCGRHLKPITLAYETYGKLNEKKDNAILVCHALSGDAHAAGWHSPNDKKPGWWDIMIGPEKAFDTNKYFVICSNVIGGCGGSTGPSSINPSTGKPYGLRFPQITIKDMVKAQYMLLKYLGIPKLRCVVGGSMGGMQALSWSVEYSNMVTSAIVIASTSRVSAQQIAFDEVGRQAIMGDPAWNNGDYYGTPGPVHGLALARMIGHITYLSEETLRRKFDRRLQEKENYSFDFSREFQVESYLHYKGARFVERFDANSYLYITKAMDYFDIEAEYKKSLREIFKEIEVKFCIVSFTSDWLFPTYQSKEIVKALKGSGKSVTFCEIDSTYGHDAFLLEREQLEFIIKNFLKNV